MANVNVDHTMANRASVRLLHDFFSHRIVGKRVLDIGSICGTPSILCGYIFLGRIKI